MSRTRAQRHCSRDLAEGGGDRPGIEYGLDSLRPTYRVRLLEAPRTCYDSMRTCRGDRQLAASQHSRPPWRAPPPQKDPTARSTRRSRSRSRESWLQLSPAWRPHRASASQNSSSLLTARPAIPFGSYPSSNTASTSFAERPEASICLFSFLRASCSSL